MIGGGPAGFYAAYCLARAARSVAVFEEHQEIGSPVHCTGLLAIEAFSRFTLPQDSILATMRRAPGFTLQVGTSFPLHRNEDETVVLDRPSFDRGLADQAVKAGVDLFLGHRIKTLHRVRLSPPPGS